LAGRGHIRCQPRAAIPTHDTCGLCTSDGVTT
jgi:hypothetical protein